MSATLTIRPLQRHEWSEAKPLAARAFVGEPFMVELFGPDLLPRFALAHRRYQSLEWHDEMQHLGAFVDDVLVGFCVASASGRCHVCLHTDPDEPPDDPLALGDWQFKVNVKVAHANLASHAWLGRVAVEPALHGGGIGRTLLAHATAALRADDARVVLLECQVHREEFYRRCGFERVATLPDPAGPDAVLMSADLQEDLAVVERGR